jgi:hypothetical protein
MQEIKSIDPMSLAKIKALFGIIIGLVYGILVAVILSGRGLSAGIPGLEALGVMAIIILPIILGILAFIIGAIVALIYNFLAEKIGGIQVSLVQK